MQEKWKKKEFTINYSLGVNANLSILFVNIYNESKEQGKNYIPFTSVAKIVMLSMYDKFVKESLILKIEELLDSEKKELVKECIADGLDYTKESLTQKCKILYTIRQINNYS